MASDDSFQVIAFLTFIGGGLVIKGIKDFKTKRRVADMACSKAATAAQGLTELEGFAWNMEPPLKNMASQDVCYRHVSIQKYISGQKKNYWETQLTHSTSQFYLVDATGAVQILMANKIVQAKPKYQKWQSLPAAYQNQILALDGVHHISGFPPKGWLSSSFRICEISLPLGCPIYAQGYFSSPSEIKKRIDPDGLSHFFEILQRKSKQPIHTMLSIDRNRDGRVCEEEAQSAFVSAGQVALRRQKETSTKSTIPVYGLLTSSSEHSLIVAGQHQHYLLQNLGFWYLMEIIAGAALIAAAAFISILKI